MLKQIRVGGVVILAALTATLFTGCGAIPQMDGERYVKPLGGATVMANLTSYTKELDCLGEYVKQANLPLSRFAVGRVDDYSGKQDLVNGKRMTQGAALMVISALARTRLPIVERLDTSVAEMELKYTDNKLIGDTPASADNPFRKTIAGTVIGSDYHIVGGITEVNYNVRSGSLETSVSSIGASGRYAVLDVAMDLRLVNTRTLQVVGVASVQKQIIGTEIRAGIFRFLSDSVIDINAADKAQEPIQKAVRMLTERAVFQLVSGVYRIPSGQCDGPIGQRVASKSTVPAPAPAVPTGGAGNLSAPAERQLSPARLRMPPTVLRLTTRLGPSSDAGTGIGVGAAATPATAARSPIGASNVNATASVALPPGVVKEMSWFGR